MTSPLEDVKDDIETSLFLADAYHEENRTGLRDEACRKAWREYLKHEGSLETLTGAELGHKMKDRMAEWELL